LVMKRVLVELSLSMAKWGIDWSILLKDGFV
jgi:hypothetical protein